MDHGGFPLDDDEEVRDEDLAVDDDVDAAFQGSGLERSGNGGSRAASEDLDVDVDLDEDQDDEVDPVTTVDENTMLQFAEAGGPGMRLRGPALGASAPSSAGQRGRKATRKRAQSTPDTGVHRKPNVTPRSKS